INRLMGDSGIETLASIHGKDASYSATTVSSADQPSLPEEMYLQSSVLMRANPPHGGQRVWTLRHGYVSSSGQPPPATITLQAQPAPVHVVSSSCISGEGSKAAVYNLEVEGAHEYFAQGILVHNCRYILHATFGHGRSAQIWLNHHFDRPESQ